MANTIFIVDDERIIADSLTAILKLSGMDASAYYDAESVLLACEIAEPNCLLSDVAMPGVNGIELAIQVKERFPACKILLFSGHASTADLLSKARAEGHTFELLSKPLHPKDLLAKLGVVALASSKERLLAIPA